MWAWARWLLVLTTSILALAGVGTAQGRGSSTWGASQLHLGPGPVGNTAIVPWLFTDGTDALTWFRFESDTSFYRDTISITQHGRRFPAGRADSGSYYNYYDAAVAADAHGDMAWVYSATVWRGITGDQGPTAIEVGTRVAGHAPGPPRRIGVYPDAYTPVRIAVSRGGRLIVAWVAGKGALYAAVGRVGGRLSRPFLVTAPGHRVLDPYEFAVAIDPGGEAFAAWRDVVGQTVEVMVRGGSARGFGPAHALTNAAEYPQGPMVMAQNDAGEMFLAWKNRATIRHPGGGFSRPSSEGVRTPLAAAVDRDGVGYLVGAGPRKNRAVVTSARALSGHFARPHSIAVRGSPRVALTAPGHGAVLALTGFTPGVVRPVSVTLLGADGTPGPAVRAVEPSSAVSAIGLAVRADGAALLTYGTDIGDPFVDLNVRRGHVGLGSSP